MGNGKGSLTSRSLVGTVILLAIANLLLNLGAYCICVWIITKIIIWMGFEVVLSWKIVIGFWVILMLLRAWFHTGVKPKYKF